MKFFFFLTVLHCLVLMNSGDIPPGIRNIICMMQHGTCRLFFCHGGERKGEICSDPWNRCCISTAEEERNNKLEKSDKADMETSGRRPEPSSPPRA
ncbi:hypothetical protein QTO34_016430 [Cnephaeus nilssonii]|uniref:Beta-defensin-like domain-containing protein n=1 Tax=Cnephaeus nilssonii TaxID=3371016 RepID=A0AA40I363_CNENI|nr:hypothetical protein QTO34_016430 [Eptesicus nilssonii]